MTGLSKFSPTVTSTGLKLMPYFAPFQGPEAMERPFAGSSGRGTRIVLGLIWCLNFEVRVLAVEAAAC